jgi:hypothetical protein
MHLWLAETALGAGRPIGSGPDERGPGRHARLMRLLVVSLLALFPQKGSYEYSALPSKGWEVIVCRYALNPGPGRSVGARSGNLSTTNNSAVGCWEQRSPLQIGCLRSGFKYSRACKAWLRAEAPSPLLLAPGQPRLQYHFPPKHEAWMPPGLGAVYCANSRLRLNSVLR